MMGDSQAVRHLTVTQASAGSIPALPAICPDCQGYGKILTVNRKKLTRLKDRWMPCYRCLRKKG